MIDVKDLIKIVGADNVSQEPAVLDAFSKDISFVNPVRPEYVVKPGDAGAIQSIIKLANDTLTPIYQLE